VEYSGSLYLIDQHAAHERILYDKLKRDRSTQRLLVPYEFTVERDQLELVAERIEIARTLGIHIEHAGDQRFRVLSVPQSYFGTEAYLADAITGLEVVSGEFERELYSRIACRSAIVYGDSIDPVSATELAQSVFALEEARCPHGRPLYFAISEDYLRKSVGREELRVKHRNARF
jgi:DNA mismatch repair protein MutL